MLDPSAMISDTDLLAVMDPGMGTVGLNLAARALESSMTEVARCSFLSVPRQHFDILLWSLTNCTEIVILTKTLIAQKSLTCNAKT